MSNEAEIPSGKRSLASLTGTHPEVEPLKAVVAPATGTDLNRIRFSFTPRACFRFEDSHFEFDSSFIFPRDLTFNAGPLKKLLDKHAGFKLSIFGHTDPVGNDDYNKVLSGRHAGSLRADDP